VRKLKYDWLRGYRPVSIESSSEAIREILALAEAIRRAYDGHYRPMRGRRRRIYVTDALVTKIILGSLACLPAYDTLVGEGMRLEGIPHSSLSQRNIEALFGWYLRHEREFRSVERRLDEDGIRYPPMKLVDMYLWERGKRSLANSSG
jgi:hypothetical protein